VGKGDPLKDFDDLYDMPEQNELREDCHTLVGGYFPQLIKIIHALANLPFTSTNYYMVYFCKSYWIIFILNLVDQLANEADEKLPVASDLESILTFYCKSRGLSYSRDNGWLNVLQPMLAMRYSKADLYNCFYAFITKYIPR
jgi:hypothetical protein